jgi:hypothetical protein
MKIHLSALGLILISSRQDHACMQCNQTLWRVKHWVYCLWIFLKVSWHELSLWVCRNPSFGLATKAKGLQGCGPRGSPRVKAKKKPENQGKEAARVRAKKNPKTRKSLGVTSHTPKSVRKCEGVWGSEPSHSQDNSHFGRWSPWRAPKSRGETHLRVSQSQVAEIVT